MGPWLQMGRTKSTKPMGPNSAMHCPIVLKFCTLGQCWFPQAKQFLQTTSDQIQDDGRRTNLK